MKIRKFQELNEGLRLNTNILQIPIGDEHDIVKVIEDLESLSKNLKYYLSAEDRYKDILDDINRTVLELASWQSDYTGAKKVATKTDENEWIPLW